MTKRRLTAAASHAIVAATGEVYFAPMPPLYGTVERDGWHWDWTVTTGSRLLAEGTARTPWSAWNSAARAAQRPTIMRGVA